MTVQVFGNFFGRNEGSPLHSALSLSPKLREETYKIDILSFIPACKCGFHVTSCYKSTTALLPRR
jgi:hypothetical protein